MERFACETEVISGEGALSVLGERKKDKILLVTDLRSRCSDGVEMILRRVQPGTTAFYENVAPEPALQQAVEGAKQISVAKPDLVVAFGGRNVLDCAKAMVCFSRENCHLAVIPWAFGSGAETTGRVELFHNRSRHTLQDRKMRPDVAIFDPAVSCAATRTETAEGGFLLLANSLGAYTAKHCGVMASVNAREAFAACWAALSAAVTGSAAARQRIAFASAMAGIAYDRAGLGLCHALSSGLESIFHIPEGRLAGILLPVVIRYSCGASQRRCAELARAAGLGGSNAQSAAKNLITGLIRLRQELELPATLAQAGLDAGTVRRHTAKLVQLTLENPDCRNTPVAADDFVIRRILEEITGHY